MNTAGQQNPKGFMTLDKYFVAGFIIYLIIGWYLSTSEFSKKTMKSCKDSNYEIMIDICEYFEKTLSIKGLSVIFFLLGCYIWLMLIYYVRTENTKGPKQYGLSRQKIGLSSLTSFLSNIAILIVVVALLLLLIMATLNMLGKWSRTTNAVLITLNVLNVITILSIIYIYFIRNIEWNETPNSIFSLLKNIVFYIPCIFIDLVDRFTGEYKRTSRNALVLLLIEAIIITLYFLFPILVGMTKDEIGNRLLDGPVYLNNEYTLGSYEELAKKHKKQTIIETSRGGNNVSKRGEESFDIDISSSLFGNQKINVDYGPHKWPSNNMPAKYDYNYALSCWIYINPQPPSTNHNYSNYARLLDYGGKPTINYKGKTNTLQITMQTNKNVNEVVYEESGFLLQKWNHILINYDGGTLDVFINNDLVSSTPSVIPYMRNDLIYSGIDNGIHGGISNVVYFDEILDKNEISILYETAKLKNPPLL